MTTLTLVKPPLVSAKDNYTMPMTPPLGLAYVAAMALEKGAEVVAIDALAEAPERFVEDGVWLYQGLSIEETVERIPERSTLVGLSCMFTQDWLANRKLIRAIRARFPGVPIVIGGEHSTALSEWSLRDCPDLDYVVRGEGEETMAEIVECLLAGRPFDHVAGLAYLRDGRYVQNADRGRIRDVDAIPEPAWHLFPLDGYLASRNVLGVYRGRSMPLLATRGCPYQCTFCSNPVMYGTRWEPRSPTLVLDEVEHLMRDYGATDFPLCDLTMVLKKDWILEFTRQIEERGLKFTWQLPAGTRAEIFDEEIAAALIRSGCRTVAFAPESGSPDTLKRIKKKVKLDRVLEAARASLRQGMTVKTFLIVGFPFETRREMLKTLVFGWRLSLLGVHDVPLFNFSPYPGSELFEEVRERHFPEGLTDRYFESIACQTHLSRAAPYNLHMSPFELNLWRVVGMASNYGLGFLVRPWRFVEFVRNVFFREQKETHIETKFAAMLDRFRALLAPRAGSAPTWATPRADGRSRA